MMRSRTKRITLAAVLTAAGLILGYMESFIVIPIRVPGIRLGLANITTLIALYLTGFWPAVAVSLVRVALCAALFGSPVSFIYSLCGAVSALAGMIAMKRLGFSIHSVSVCAAVLHNTAQITVAALMTGSGFVFTYMPVLLIAGIIAGILTGSLSDILISRLDRYGIRKERE